MNKKLFNINDYIGNYVMHCKTKEDAVEFVEYLNSTGAQWSNGDKYSESSTYWERYGIETCYNFNKGCFGDVECYKRIGYIILEAENYLFDSDDFEIHQSENDAFNSFIDEYKIGGK